MPQPAKGVWLHVPSAVLPGPQGRPLCRATAYPCFQNRSPPSPLLLSLALLAFETRALVSCGLCFYRNICCSSLCWSPFSPFGNVAAVLDLRRHCLAWCPCWCAIVVSWCACLPCSPWRGMGSCRVCAAEFCRVCAVLFSFSFFLACFLLAG